MAPTKGMLTVDDVYFFYRCLELAARYGLPAKLFERSDDGSYGPQVLFDAMPQLSIVVNSPCYWVCKRLDPDDDWQVIKRYTDLDSAISCVWRRVPMMGHRAPTIPKTDPDPWSAICELRGMLSKNKKKTDEHDYELKQAAGSRTSLRERIKGLEEWVDHAEKDLAGRLDALEKKTDG